MGAAIPHLLQLSVALPKILPFPPEDISTQVFTGTVEVRDEIIPDDEDEEVTYQTRGKSTLTVIIKIGDGRSEAASDSDRVEERQESSSEKSKGTRKGNKRRKGKEVQASPEEIIFQEPEQDDA
jgi:ribonuclease P/MRP protein subunit RPP20